MSDQIWYVAVDGKQEGPYKAEEIEERIRSGSVARGAHVYRTAWATGRRSSASRGSPPPSAHRSPSRRGASLMKSIS